MNLTPFSSALDLIGNTRTLQLPREGGAARIVLKIESDNPTGSMKDRMALAMIEAAETDGRLAPEQAVVEYTGGSTGVSLALVCAVKGYPLHIVTSDAFSAEKRDQMTAYGAHLTLVESDGGGMDASLTHRMIEAADQIRQSTGAFWTDQLNNADPLAGYANMADEIREQTGGRIDAFVQSVGTCGSLRGVGEALRATHPEVRLVAGEPAESAVLSGQPSGSHRIEGVGAGFVVPLWRADLVDEIVAVSTADAMDETRALARQTGLFAGTSTGANLVAARRVARELGEAATVVTVMCDSGLKYLSTELFGGLAPPS